MNSDTFRAPGRDFPARAGACAAALEDIAAPFLRSRRRLMARKFRVALIQRKRQGPTDRLESPSRSCCIAGPSFVITFSTSPRSAPAWVGSMRAIELAGEEVKKAAE